MNTSIRNVAGVLTVVIAFLGITLYGVSDASAQQKAASSAEQLIGYWTLVSVTNEQDGKITETFGPNPKGLFIFDRSGRYVVLQFKADIPKFASNSRDKGTPEENRAVVQGSSVHYGTYTVNEKEGSFTVRPEAATFPNWVGIDQKRSFSISDDVLMITNPSGSTGGTSKLVLKRAR
jgi:hypothetical protein